MAEAFNDKDLPAEKAARYAAVAEEIAAVLAGEPNAVARMATVAAMLAQSFDHYFWTGFYVVDADRPVTEAALVRARLAEVHVPGADELAAAVLEHEAARLPRGDGRGRNR